MPQLCTFRVRLDIHIWAHGRELSKDSDFNVELKKRHALSQTFMNSGIMGLVLEYMNIGPVVIQKMDMRDILLVFLEDVGV